MFVSFCFHTTYVLCKGFFRFHEVLQLMVEGGAVLQGQMLKEGLCEAWLRRGAPHPGQPLFGVFVPGVKGLHWRDPVWSPS